MKTVLLLLCLVGISTANLLRQQYFPQWDVVYQPMENLDYPNFFARPESQERLNYDDYPLAISTEKSTPYFTKTIQRELPKYGDVITWKGIQIASGPKSTVNNKMDIVRIFDDAYKTLQQINVEKKETYHQAYRSYEQNNFEEASMNATQLIMKHHYTVEEHVVKTDDGYILTMFHVLPRENKMLKPPVVFLMHGLLGSADDWLLMNRSLAYMLADAGCEVWLGNARGSKYSRNHVSKHPAQTDFWKFSIDEIAHHDLPAMIDYALKTSEQEKLFYVGHSQGTTAFFALISTQPEYRNKINMMYALAPMVYMTNTRSPLLRMMTPNSPFYENLQHQLGYGELRLSKELVHTIGGNMCQNQIGCKHICGNVNFVVTGMNPTNMDADLVPVIMDHVPAGASTRQIKHYGQAVAASELRKYDYGAETNTQVYGNSQPPKYNMTDVKVPVSLYYSDDDWMAHPSDVERLHQELPDVRDFYRIPDEHFNHMDFQFSRRAPVVVNQRLVDSIRNY